MILLPRISLLAVLGSATFCFAASIPKTILPDNVVVCEPSAGCVNKTLFGRSYKVISTPRFTVMVSVSQEGAYTRADVSVSNNTDMPLAVSPDDFRVEVVTPKPKVLLYVPPSELNLPPATSAPPKTPSPSLNPQPAVLQTPSPDHQSFVATESEAPATPFAANAAGSAAPQMTETQMLYAAQEQKIAQHEAAERAAFEKHLSATSVPPNEVARGRVYFERDKKSHLVNVVLPIAGIVFEFPYSLKH
jgi:hypothetical protein